MSKFKECVYALECKVLLISVNTHFLDASWGPLLLILYQWE